MMSRTPLSHGLLERLLDLPDLTLSPNHAVSRMVEDVRLAALEVVPSSTLSMKELLERGNRIAHAEHNYHLLGYSPNDVVLSQAHTQWLDHERLLRTQTTSVILEQLQRLTASPSSHLLLTPGMVYRRDVRDRTHCGQPHQIDVWWLLPKQQQPEDPTSWLLGLMKQVLPDVALQALATQHPYTQHGKEIQAQWQGQWLEIGEGGLIDPALLERLGLDSGQWGGVASGWGLDRLVMVRKDLPDIRLLRDPLPAIAQQMQDLRPWKAVSRQPTAVRQLSLARPQDESEEALTESILGALPEEADGCLQEVVMEGLWSPSELPAAAKERLGLQEDQRNRLIKLVWQSPSRSIERDQINAWSRQLYRACHQGTAWTYCP